MRIMLRQIFSTFTTFFQSMERGANALDSYAQWAEEEAKDFQATSAIQRARKLEALTDG